MSDKSGAPPPGTGRGRGQRRDKSVGRKPGVDDSCVAKAATASASASAASGSSSSSSDRMSVTTSTSSTTSSTADLTDDTTDSDYLAKRVDFGTVGRKIQLRCNNFVIELSECPKSVYQYHIVVSNEHIRILTKEDKYAVFWEAIKKHTRVEDFHTVVYDGGVICYSQKRLITTTPAENVKRFDVDLPQYGRNGRFSIVIELTAHRYFGFADKGRKTALTILDLAYRQAASFPRGPNDEKLLFHPFGNSFFSEPMPGDRISFDMDGGRQVWGGYFLGVKIAVDFIPVLNIDVANGVFIKKQSALQFMCDIFNQGAGVQKYRIEQLETLTKPYELSTEECRSLAKAIKGLSITADTSPDAAKKCWGLSRDTAERTTFEWTAPGSNNKRTVTIPQYYRERYGRELRYPFFPCLETGTKTRPTYFPIEMCHMHTPQRVGGKLTEQQTTTMIRGVCVDAVERQNRILNAIKRSQICEDPFAKKFGFCLKPELMNVSGRVLDPPALEYSGSAKVNPREGTWNMGSSKFFVAASIGCYGLISFLNRNAENEMAAFCKMLMDSASKMGMRVDNQMPAAFTYIKDTKEVKQAMDEVLRECAAKGKKCDFILVTMMGKDADRYAAVKSVAERELGIITQVVIQRNIRQPKPTTCSNIVLKLNAKLGGVNCKLYANMAAKYLINQPTLVLGVDVTHPPPSDKKGPSVGAVVGNIDTLHAKYGASVHVQTHRREDVIYLTGALQKRVEAFYNQTQRKPENIIVYRDGVAETQFQQILTEECKSITKACALACGSDFVPKITFIIVQKRHHTRFFCVNKGDMSGKAMNVPPGTVVDNVVTHPSQYDYYLCSHFGIQGTSRPAHYHVLRDDNGFSSDALQAITYSLCHVYARCTRAVSIPAPTYYAHLVCNRARSHLKELCGDGTSDTQSIDSGDARTMSTTDREEQLKKAVTVADSLATRMYFC